MILLWQCDQSTTLSFGISSSGFLVFKGKGSKFFKGMGVLCLGGDKAAEKKHIARVLQLKGYVRSIY